MCHIYPLPAELHRRDRPQSGGDDGSGPLIAPQHVRRASSIHKGNAEQIHKSEAPGDRGLLVRHLSPANVTNDRLNR